MSTRIALIGCSKEKRTNEKGCALARDLYVSPLFRAALAHAESIGFDAIYILSAKHGLVQLTDVLGDYDFTMAELDADDRAWWAHHILGFLERHHVPRFSHPNVELTVFAGALYVEPIRDQLPEWPGFTVVAPLEGLQVGERLSWFKQRRAA